MRADTLRNCLTEEVSRHVKPKNVKGFMFPIRAYALLHQHWIKRSFDVSIFLLLYFIVEKCPDYTRNLE